MQQQTHVVSDVLSKSASTVIGPPLDLRVMYMSRMAITLSSSFSNDQIWEFRDFRLTKIAGALTNAPRWGMK